MGNSEELLSFEILVTKFSFIPENNWQVTGQTLFEKNTNKIGRFWILSNNDRFWIMINNKVVNEVFNVSDLEKSYFENTGIKLESN